MAQKGGGVYCITPMIINDATIDIINGIVMYLMDFSGYHWKRPWYENISSDDRYEQSHRENDWECVGGCRIYPVSPWKRTKRSRRSCY